MAKNEDLELTGITQIAEGLVKRIADDMFVLDSEHEKWVKVLDNQGRSGITRVETVDGVIYNFGPSGWVRENQ